MKLSLRSARTMLAASSVVFFGFMCSAVAHAEKRAPAMVLRAVTHAAAPVAPAPRPATEAAAVRRLMAAPMHCAPAVESNIGTRVQYCAVGR
jgi:hypothetical protein